jgi:7-keto-8-aminopelargonate synthetase-like enzyme
VNSFTKTLGSIGAIGALALGGSAFADAASNSSTTTTSSTSTTAAKSSTAKPAGRHIGANGKQEQALSADVAKKVAAAALDKVGGGTVIRTETDVDHGSPYEAHVQKSDGTQVEVLVNSNFEVTAVNAMGQHP